MIRFRRGLATGIAALCAMAGTLFVASPAQAATCAYTTHIDVLSDPSQGGWAVFVGATASQPAGPTSCRVRIYMDNNLRTGGSISWYSNDGYFNFGGWDVSAGEAQGGRAGGHVDMQVNDGYARFDLGFVRYFIYNGNTLLGTCTYHDPTYPSPGGGRRCEK